MYKNQRFRSLFAQSSTMLAGFFIIAGLIQSIAAQDDPNRPGKLNNGEAAGRWQTGEDFSRSYSFVAGPGEIKVLYFFRAAGAVNVCGEVIDDKGRAVDELNALEERRMQTSYGFIYGMPNPTERLIGRHNIKRRQKLIVRVYHCMASGLEVPSGSYSIKVEGAGVDSPDAVPATAATQGSSEIRVLSASDGKSLTLAQILTGLQSIGSTPETKTLAARNKFIVNKALKRNISFSLTVDREKDLRAAGASDELIWTLRGLSANRAP
jgi:hypothetical protein